MVTSKAEDISGHIQGMSKSKYFEGLPTMFCSSRCKYCLGIYLPLYRKRVLDALDLDDCVGLGQRDVDCLTLLEFPGVRSVSQVVAIRDSSGAEICCYVSTLIR